MCFHEFFFCRQNEWVHANCALWSSEVYEEVDGSLQNVSQALSRGSKLTCTVCNKRGATIGEFFLQIVQIKLIVGPLFLVNASYLVFS